MADITEVLNDIRAHASLDYQRAIPAAVSRCPTSAIYLFRIPCSLMCVNCALFSDVPEGKQGQAVVSA